MNYRVELGARARNDLDAAYRFAARNAPESADRWQRRFKVALATLGSHPQRCGLAPESRRFRLELRQLLFGHRRFKYRAIYYIDGNLVHVVRIRRASMRPLRRIDLEDADSDHLN
jgi:plasmid stabilization system protein ParE